MEKSAFSYQQKQDSYRFEGDIKIGHTGTVGKIPLLLFLDYAAAFTSVSHSWMFLVLNAIGLPKGWLNLIECLYESNEAFSESPEGFV